jgi:hypothetical protein
MSFASRTEETLSRTAAIMFTLTVLTAIVWALHFVPQVGLPPDLADFAGGMSIGLLIGAVVTWAGERTPPK